MHSVHYWGLTQGGKIISIGIKCPFAPLENPPSTVCLVEHSMSVLHMHTYVWTHIAHLQALYAYTYMYATQVMNVVLCYNIYDPICENPT